MRSGIAEGGARGWRRAGFDLLRGRPRRDDRSVNVDVLFWLAMAATFASCLGAIGARALREFSRHELQELCQRRQKLDRFGEIVRSHDQVALGVEMFVVVMVAVATTFGGIWAYEEFVLPEPMWLELLPAVAGLALIIVVMSVCLPWAISRVGAEGFLYHTWPTWQLIGVATRPLVWCAYAFDSMIQRVTGRVYGQLNEDAFEEEIRSIVTEGHREGLLEEEAREMIEGVIELGDVVVSHIMTPRTEMNMLQVEQPWDEVIDYVTASGHTRIPVYDKSRDDIVGILYSKDLLPELAKRSGESRRPLPELLRKPLFVPESLGVTDLLRTFQQSRTHIAIVLDEYGGVSGLVTIEDVLEEIVGEIDDEYDSPPVQDIVKLDDDRCEALGRAHVDQINAEMG